MRNKELKNEVLATSRGISKASLPVSVDLSNEFTAIILETDQRKIYSSSD